MFLLHHPMTLAQELFTVTGCSNSAIGKDISSDLTKISDFVESLPNEEQHRGVQPIVNRH
jgi:hypothetical protein